jgi:ketosteroid isomerase-like protein
MASQAYDKALQLDKGNTVAQTKLNLIKDLFSVSPGVPKPAVTGKIERSTKVAVAPPAAKAPEKAAAAAKATPKAEAARSPDEVLKAVNGWAQAWSGNDVDGYLAHYASDFQTPKGESRAKWESERKTRIAKPRKIQVLIESPKVVFTENDRVRVTFRQNYRSDTLTTASTKTLVMVKAGDRWLIQQEKVGG